ncbi:MAG TPA: beta-L-arabinofuranosidase domain-containing protein [Candidatus Saccharimonadales bacterium]|nr:beta-L-arabinofuranosidase domain-containing protein [Candidatus Saccharimonadales bacterium]
MKKLAFGLLISNLFLPVVALAQAPNQALAFRDKIIKVRPLPLNSVRLTGGPLKTAQDLDAKYLLDLEPDRMLAFLRERAGLAPKAKGYGGWDGPGRQLTGHIAGHYLSAVSYMWAATGDTRFKERADKIVQELKEIQDQQGDGYLGALLDKDGVDGKIHFEELCRGVVRSGGFDLNGLWSPWYVEHKLYAGLRDAYRYTGNRTALDVEIKFAGWADSILSKMSDEDIQKMLATEFGGMNEIAADLYADTGDVRWLGLSRKFHHRAIVDPLANGEDVLAGKHGNTNVPKLLGSLTSYIYTGDPSDYRAATFFFDQVALHHSFATGGHGKNEYFGPADKLNDMIDGRTAETCNVYNMIKMARELFSVEPDIHYADFHERALFNHILASQDPRDGSVCYMVPVGRGVQHEYQDKFEDFTCCVGTGMESHALHGYGIYYESGEKLWVNLYAPTIASWDAKGVKLEMRTDFPAGQSASLKITPVKPTKFTLALRRPYWAGAGFSVKLNGTEVRNLPKADSYVEISRTWKQGDTIELVLPKTLRTEPLPDNPNRVALLWGPLVLAGDLGPEQERRRSQERTAALAAAPVLVAAAQPVANWLKPVPGKPGSFRTTGVGLESDVDFVPFYELPRRRYAIYWDMFTPQEWQKKSEAYAAEQEKKKKLDAATVAFAQPGQMQAERDFNQQGEETAPIQTPGHFGRKGTKWFSFDLPVDAAHPMTLVATYSNDGRRKGTFNVLVDGRKIGEQTTERRSPEQDIRFFDVEYALPADLVQGKQKVTVRFEARDAAEISGVFGIRMIRADSPR